MNTQNIYSSGLDKNAANYSALSPLTFIERAASVYPDRIALIYGDYAQSWVKTYQRCRQLASALSKAGVSKDDTVAVMLPNVPAMYEAHFAVPMVGAVLNALNFRLDSNTIAYILNHSEAKVLLVDEE